MMTFLQHVCFQIGCLGGIRRRRWHRSLACRVIRMVNLARRAQRQAFELRPTNCVVSRRLGSNLCAAAQRTMVALGCLALATTARAQSGMFVVTVANASSQPIAGVEVKITGGPGVTRTGLTGSDGMFRQSQLPAGRYQIEGTLSGFVPKSVTIQLREGETTNVSLQLAIASEPPKKADDSRSARLWVGWSPYSMTAFDEKLAGEGNNPLRQRYNIGGEIDVATFKVPVLQDPVRLPLGAEHLMAVSTTAHVVPPSTTTTVTWNLPVNGLFIGPVVKFCCGEKSGSGHTVSAYAHPWVGGYWIGSGPFSSADLTVTGFSGRLKAQDATIGFGGTIGAWFFSSAKVGFFAEAGGRYLRFNDVTVQADGDFQGTAAAPIKPGPLGYPLDYSGFVVRTGISFQYHADKPATKE